MKTPTDCLYAIDHCRGSLDCFTAYLDHPATPEEHWAGHLRRFRVTRRTAKRIYYVRREPRPTLVGFIDRQKIETDGEITRGRYGDPDYHLYLTAPPMPEWWSPKPPDAKALKAAMAAANPGRGGDPAEFRAARRRYLEACERQARTAEADESTGGGG